MDTKFRPDQEWRKETFVPFNERKKILLLSDDLRLPSGVGTMSKEIVLNTIHRFNWVQIGGAMKHPDKGKIIDMSKEFDNMTGIGTNYVRIFPYNGYGDPDLVRFLIDTEKPDAILHFTDPRQWIWLYQMEHEVRQHIPLLFYTIWDDLPFPMYNQNYYESCDTLAGISKQTYNIVKNVRKRLPLEPWQLWYLPHGVEHNVFKYVDIDNPGHQMKKFRKIKDNRGNFIKDEKGNDKKEEYSETEFEELIGFRKQFFKDRDYDFVVLYNNRNIRRKMPGDVILAFKNFNDTLTPEEAKRTALIMHTHVVDPNGTDLKAVAEAMAPECEIIFSEGKLEPRYVNYLYNISDVVINMASNEGFGLSTCESLMTETPIIANVTGGLQDQMGFVDKKGELLHHDKHYNAEWGSNHDGKYKKHGEWVYPLFPTNRALVGSPPTPYIFDDRCSFEDAAKAYRYWYDKTPEERRAAGKKGRDYLLENNFTARQMGLSFIDYIDDTIEKFEPRKRFTLYTI